MAILDPTAPPEAPADRRATILRATAAVLGRLGYANTSIKEIAAEAGVAPGLVHYYFASKDDLIVSVAAALSNEHTEHWLRAGAGIEDPVERIDAAIRYVDNLRRTNPEYHRLVFDLSVAGFTNPNIRMRMREVWDRYIALVEAEVTRIFASLGVEPQISPRAFAAGIAATIDGIALSALANGHDPAPDYAGLRTMVGSTLIAAFVAAGRPVPTERLQPLLRVQEAG